MSLFQNKIKKDIRKLLRLCLCLILIRKNLEIYFRRIQTLTIELESWKGCKFSQDLNTLKRVLFYEQNDAEL